MKTITIRDLRQRWPETEKWLEIESEIVITRDGRPVARLLRVESKSTKRKRWDPDEHKRWLKKIWSEKRLSLVDKYLQADRNARK